MSGRARLGLLLAVSLLFVVMGLVLAALGDWRLGLGNSGFFGFAAAVFAYQLSQFDELDAKAEPARVPGGIPLFASRQRRALFGVGTCVAGASSMLIGFERNPALWWIGILVVLAGAVACVLAAVGPREGFMLSPEGIHFVGGKVPCLLHFDNLAQLDCVEWNGHLILRLVPINLAALLHTVPEPQREAAGEKLQQSLAYLGAPLTLWVSQFGLGASALMKTLERYVREPAARNELRRLEK